MDKNRDLQKNIAVASALGAVVLFSFFTMSFGNGLHIQKDKVNKTVKNTPDNSVHITVDYKNKPKVTKADYKIGTGAVAHAGDTIYMHYVGQFKNGIVFDTSLDSKDKTPVKVRMDTDEMLQGLVMGISGMREGGIRRIVVPYQLAYGNRKIMDESGNVLIPRNTDLVFDIALQKVVK